jgi:signal peptidase
VRRVAEILVSAALWVVLAAVAWLLWPTSLGGGTTFILVSGHSMEPLYQPGDLLVARSGNPEVGDNIVYNPTGYGNAQVVHQIVGGNGVTGWDVKGINNSWHDPWTPTNDDVVGIVHLHVPRLGVVTDVLLSPILWASVLALALGLLLWPTSHSDDDDDDADAGREDVSVGGAPASGVART